MADNNKKEFENSEEQDANHSRQQATEDLLNKLNLNASDDETNPEVEPANKEEAQDLLSRMGFKSGHKESKHKKETEELKQQLGEQKDQYLRLYAEFDNFKKRTAKERIDWFKTAGQDIIQSLLPVLDDFERAEKTIQTSKDIDAVKEGIKLVQHKLKSTLEQRGLQPIESIGKEFNVEEHEAVTEIPAPTEDLKGKVVDEVERGYKLNDKMIRYAKVIVGK